MGLAERCAVVKPLAEMAFSSLIGLVDQRPTLGSLHKGAAKATSENPGSETACFCWIVLLVNSITQFVNLHVVSRVSARLRARVLPLTLRTYIRLESGQQAQEKLL